jgi:Zn-dependent protease with chaperone function
VSLEFTLILLFLLMAAPSATLAACVVDRAPICRSARELERIRWRRVWLPILPSAAITCILIGWAIAEPGPSDESVTLTSMVAAAPFAFVWCRALIRAFLSAAWGGPPPVAATVGLLRPKILLSPELSKVLGGAALAAVRAHEISHVSHHDPLRIWVAQLLTDLQWPVPAAYSRFRMWRRALEIARDEEVREAGTDGLALAEAILGVTALAIHPAASYAAFLDDEMSFRERIKWLLAPSVADSGSSGIARQRRILVAGVVAALTATLVGGVAFGDSLVNALLTALA